MISLFWLSSMLPLLPSVTTSAFLDSLYFLSKTQYVLQVVLISSDLFVWFLKKKFILFLLDFNLCRSYIF
jgi:hypothetical protein